MHRRSMAVLASLLLLPCFLFAQDGKIRGRVTAKDTNEPLIGANVVIDGTTLGAAADLGGDYVILSVPPGVYTVRASYIGYQTVVIANVRVNANLTTTQDFSLPSSAIAVEAMEIVAERPLIQRNTTNTVRLTTQEDIQNLPFRGVQQIVALNSGTVLQNGNLHVRGGRAGEVAYYIDGATALNPYNNSENVSIIQEAIEEIQLQSGGYTAEFGGANSAVVRTTVRTGGQDFKATLDYRTDDFAKPGEEFLSTSSFGHRNAVVTLSGPLLSNEVKFFIAGQHNYQRNRQVRFVEPFSFTDLVTDALGPSGREGAGKPLPGPVEFERNYIPRNKREDNSIQGTLAYDLSRALKFRFTGSYGQVTQPNGSQWPAALQNIFRRRLPTQETKSALANLKATHVLNAKTFYEVAVSYTSRRFREFDETFGDNWMLYADSLANAEKGYTGFVGRYEPPFPYSTVNKFLFYHENSPVGTPANDVAVGRYFRNSQSNLGASLDFTTQATKSWEIKVGGRVDRWTMRRFDVNNISAALIYLYGQDGKSPRQFESEQERQVRTARAGFMNVYGYDSFGNKINSGPDGPRHPMFWAGYVQNKLEYRDLVVNLGLRYERISTDALTPLDLENPAFDETLNYIDLTQVTTTKAEDYWLPRVNFSFPVTDRTVFYATYGKYVQLPQLTDIFTGNRIFSNAVSPVSRSPYGYFGQYAGFTAKPERTTQYEMGIRQSITDDFAFTITGFYKDLLDQLRFDRVLSEGKGTIPEGQTVFSGLLNNDFGTVKGLELTLELRRVKRLAAKLNYTLSDARGTGSDSRQTQVAVSDGGARYPILTYKLDFNQAHRGSIVLDYRFAKGDGGKILQGTGLNAILTFNSGHAYTQIQEPKTLGQSNPWNIGVYPLSDARFSNPVEPINSSTTPFNFNIDLNFSRLVDLGKFDAEFFINVLNLLNTKNIVNVYPNTGTAEDDGWLRSELAVSFSGIPRYTELYNAINRDNRWAYSTATGNDLFGSPRQIFAGIRLEF